ncbi:NAD-dependent epimerase/dehydratase family protein [Pirellulaceae bacterium SH449]
MSDKIRRILVTGATGLLGNNISRLAISQGIHTTTLARSPKSHPSLCELKGEHIQADITDDNLASLLADTGFDAVIHAAAKIHIGWKNLDESLKVNELGTRRLIEWARRTKTRVVHVSTVNCLPLGTRELPANERSTGGIQTPSSYVVSKQAAQRVCNEAIERGDDCYAVYPGFMLGPYDWQMSSGKMIAALQTFRPWAPAGGCSVCDPRDVAEAILRIALKGATSRHYILAGQNVTYLELWGQIARGLGTRPPLIAMRKPAQVVGKLLADLSNRFRNQESDFNSAAIEMAQQFHFYDSGLAETELGYSSRPYTESLRDAVEWLRLRKFLKP